MSIWRVIAGLCLSGLVMAAQVAAATPDDVARRSTAPCAKSLTLGSQPLSYPNGVFGTVMRRDRVLKARLTELGCPLASQAFKRGADMLQPMAENQLDIGLIGDMPSTVAAAAGHVWIVALVEVSQNAIVSRDVTSVAELKGKRIGYVPVSTSHATLMRALESVRLRPADVKLVTAFPNNELADALKRKDIDAFAAWEPAVSLALAASPGNHIVFRGQSVDYFVLSRAFEQAHPDAALAVVAAYVRAIEWMRQSRSNLDQAARWVLEDGQAFSGAPVGLSASKVASLIRTGILDVPSAPVIIASSGKPPLKTEYDLLKSLGQLPATEQWDHVASSFQYTGLRQVMSAARQFKIHHFDYDR